jgi:hypothetical protein
MLRGGCCEGFVGQAKRPVVEALLAVEEVLVSGVTQAWKRGCESCRPSGAAAGTYVAKTGVVRGLVKCCILGGEKRGDLFRVYEEVCRKALLGGRLAERVE